MSHCAVRLLLTAVLAGAELMDGHAMFALALVGVCEPGAEGLAALLGAALGYLSFRGVVEGLPVEVHRPGGKGHLGDEGDPVPPAPVPYSPLPAPDTGRKTVCPPLL